MEKVATQHWFDNFLDYWNDNIRQYHYERAIVNNNVVYNIFDQNNFLVTSIYKDSNDYSITIKFFSKFLMEDFHLNMVIKKCTNLLIKEYKINNIVIQQTLSTVVETHKDYLRLVSNESPKQFKLKNEIDQNQWIKFLLWNNIKTWYSQTIDVRLFLTSLNVENPNNAKYIPIRVTQVNNKWQITRVGSEDEFFEEFVMWSMFAEVSKQILKTINLVYPLSPIDYDESEIPFDQNKLSFQTTIEKSSEIEFMEFDERNIIVSVWEKWEAIAHIINEFGEIIAQVKESIHWWRFVNRTCWDDTCENIIEKLNKLWTRKPISPNTKSIIKDQENINWQLWLFQNLWIQIDPRRWWNQLIVWSHFEEFVAKTFEWEIIDKAWNYPDISTNIPWVGKIYFEVKSVCAGNYFLIKLDQLAGFSTLDNIFYTLIVYKDNTPWFVRWKKRSQENKIVNTQNLQVESIFILPANKLREYIMNSMLNDKLKLKKLGSRWYTNQKIDLPANSLAEFLKSQVWVKKIGKITYLWINLETFHHKFETN